MGLGRNVPTYSQLTNIGTRIDDLLTTGELLSTQGNTANVYDPTTATGTLEATFPLGDLRFVGEVYIGGTPTVLFSEALWYGQQLTFNVYSIPTSQPEDRWPAKRRYFISAVSI